MLESAVRERSPEGAIGVSAGRGPEGSRSSSPDSGPRTAVTVAAGDGIGPEIMAATLEILEAAGARLAPEPIEVGEAAYLAGRTSGIGPEAWDSIARTGVLLKGPITTPRGGGYKSLNVTLRKTLGLYANVRPCVSLAPHTRGRHPGMDVVVVRENEEDLYAGIEHRQTEEVTQCLKLVTRPGCERIVRHAFEHARRHGRRRVTCVVKDNIMKLTDGLFQKVFQEIGQDYPEIEQESQIVDIAAARLADDPCRFDVIATTNLYGDILSDIAAQVAGSVGLGGSSNIGEEHAMFEAIHGSAPDIAGRGIANPSGLLQAAVSMLVHLGKNDVAEKIQNAWLRTMEEGIHTADLYDPAISRRRAGTREFAEAVLERLGTLPEKLAPARFPSSLGARGTRRGIPDMAGALKARGTTTVKELVGVDLFLCARRSPEEIAATLRGLETTNLRLRMITNRGVRVWPEGLPWTFLVDHWRCRFQAEGEGRTTPGEILELYRRAVEAGCDVIKTENLCLFDGEPGFALGHGQ